MMLIIIYTTLSFVFCVIGFMIRHTQELPLTPPISYYFFSGRDLQLIPRIIIGIIIECITIGADLLRLLIFVVGIGLIYLYYLLVKKKDYRKLKFRELGLLIKKLKQEWVRYNG